MNPVNLSLENFKIYVDNHIGKFSLKIMLDLLEHKYYDKLSYLIENGIYEKEKIDLLLKIRDVPDEIKIKIKINEL